MICSLKVPLASRMSVKPALATRMPRMISPAGPNKLNSSIGNKPIRKIGSSGSTMNRLRASRAHGSNLTVDK